MMMTMDDYHHTTPDFTNHTHPDIDWSVFENADRYLLRDDSAWINRLSNDFWWNLERISEMCTKPLHLIEQINSTKIFPPQVLPPPTPSSLMQSNGNSARKIVGQRSTITRPNPHGIPERSNFSSMYEQDIEYNPFQSKISFDNNIWTNYSQQAIPWQ